MKAENVRNIAIIAHVDHGKTTLVDQLLSQSGTLSDHKAYGERLMDSGDIEKERGITILSKNTAIRWRDLHINIVDTPGHADFGGEVERILSMVDSVLLLVDAFDGPMPQTRFVTQKAFMHGLKPIVVVNKVDRPGATPDAAIDKVFDLFDSLGATDEQLDFKVVYCSALHGYATLDMNNVSKDMTPLFEVIANHVSPPEVNEAGGFQMQVSSLDYCTYKGLMGIGRVKRGSIKPNSPVSIIDANGEVRQGRVLELLQSQGLDRQNLDSASAGDIILITGIDNLKISDTLCSPDEVEALPPLQVDEPTVSVTIGVNTSPFAGQDGKYLTSRQIKDRLDKELLYNVAIKVEDTDNPDRFLLKGRGELALSILIENMRREGFELTVSRPQVIIKVDGEEKQEPYESVTIDVETAHQGSVMERLGARKGQLKDMSAGNERVRLEYVIPARGLIGFHTEFMTLTSGTGLIYHVFDHYGPFLGGDIGQRHRGALISNGTGKATGFSLFNLQERGRLFIGPQVEVYEGMVVGEHARDNDLVVNVIKGKQLTNIRAAGSDENILLTPPIKHSLEEAMEFIADDEWVEVTPKNIRFRKQFLKEHERKRQKRQGD